MKKLSTHLKICGVTQTNQALEIASLGVHAIGVIGVESSPRFVPLEDRNEIFKNLLLKYPKVERVLVVANMKDEEIQKNTKSNAYPTVIQLHGNESIEKCRSLKTIHPEVKWWKALQIKNKENIENIKKYADYIDAILLDSWHEKQLGGTGSRINLDLLENEKFKSKLWIAGGISPEWIPNLFKIIKPYGIDCSSKVEITPGIKDINKIKILINTLNKLI